MRTLLVGSAGLLGFLLGGAEVAVVAVALSPAAAAGAFLVRAPAH